MPGYKEMKAVLIQPNVMMKDTGIQINHGLAVLASILLQNGCDADLNIIDTVSFNNKSYLKFIAAGNYDLVAVTAYSNQWEFIKQIASGIREITAAPVICGGPHATLFPGAICETDAIDAFVIGEGETAIGDIVRGIRSGNGWLNTQGIRSRNVAARGAAQRTEDIDVLPFPDYEIYDRKIVHNYPGIFFSRGCPYNCSYCCNSAYRAIYGGQGKPIRFMSPPRAVALARRYKDTIGPDHFEVDDDTFTKNPKWLREFLAEYRKDVNIPFNCNARPETITPEVARLLKESGCMTVSIGIESGDENIRRQVLKRNMKNSFIEKSAEIIHREGLKLSTFNMVGLPGETWSSFYETVRLNQRIKPDNVQISIYYPFRGTELGESCYSGNLVEEHANSGSYFGKSILKLPGFPKWKISAGQRLFKFLVFSKSSLLVSVRELLKDIIKSLPLSYLLIPPYLKMKKYLAAKGGA